MRTTRSCRRTRNVLAVLAALSALAAAYHGARVAGSPHDTWSFAAAAVLGIAAYVAGARVHILKARDRATEAWTQGYAEGYVDGIARRTQSSSN